MVTDTIPLADAVTTSQLVNQPDEVTTIGVEVHGRTIGGSVVLRGQKIR